MRSSSLPVRFIIFNSLLNMLSHYEEHSTYSLYFPSSLWASEYVPILRRSCLVWHRCFHVRDFDSDLNIYLFSYESKQIDVLCYYFTRRCFHTVRMRKAQRYREMNEGCAEWKQDVKHYIMHGSTSCAFNSNKHTLIPR